MTIAKAGFADKIKQQCYDLYAWAGLRDRDYYDENPREREIVLPLLCKSPRQIWIEFGTLVGRQVHSGTWAKYLFWAFRDVDVLIVTDLRFPEEAKLIQQFGGRVYRIDRPEIPHTSDIADDPLAEWEGWDGILLNGGTLSQFHDLVIGEVMPWLQGH